MLTLAPLVTGMDVDRRDVLISTTDRIEYLLIVSAMGSFLW